MYCSACGQPNAASSRFCSACGSNLSAPAVVAQPAMYAYTPVKLIESIYTHDQLVTAGAGRRLGGYLLNVVILFFTLGIGWLVWFAIVAPRGQSPGKQLLGMYIIKSDGTRAGGGYTWLRTIVIRGLLTYAIDFLTLGIFGLLSSLWCIWDKETQCL